MRLVEKLLAIIALSGVCSCSLSHENRRELEGALSAGASAAAQNPGGTREPLDYAIMFGLGSLSYLATRWARRRVQKPGGAV